jgi:hypothetical protein
MSDAFGDMRTLPASKQAKDQMKQLKSKGLFKEQRDVWTLGAAIGIAFGKTYEEGDRGTFQGVDSLDEDGVLRAVMSGMYPDMEPKERANRLVNHAEWGIREIYRREKNGTLNFSEFCTLNTGKQEETNEDKPQDVDGIKIDIDELIKNGENEKIEFKSSLCWDIEKKNKNKAIEAIFAKSVAAFMNTEGGGYLLIGVKDDKTILGLENDYKVLIKNHIGKSLQDAIHLHFGNIIDDYLGGENGPHVTMRFAEKNGKTIAIAVVPKMLLKKSI